MLHPEVTGATSTGSSTTGYEELFRSLFLHHTFFFLFFTPFFLVVIVPLCFEFVNQPPKWGGPNNS